MSVDDVSPIRPGDKVKISLYGLPESGWLEVVDVDPRHSRVMATLPSGWTRWFYSGDEITAHEPAAHEPAEVPHWLAARVIKDGNGYLGLPDMRSVVFATGAVLGWQEVAEPVTVIVDRDGNLPAAEGYRQDALTEIRNRRTVEAELDNWKIAYRNINEERAEARADLAAFRAEVAKVRDDVRNLYHHQIEQRLTAILDGVDQ